MRITKLILAACLCVALTSLAALPLHAQDRPADQQRGDNAPQQARERGGEPTIDLDFAGGTAEKYIDAIRKQAPNLNIIVTADLSDVPMPAVKLRHVNPGSALEVLERLPRDLPGRRVEISVGSINQRAPDDAPIWTVQAQIQPFDGPELQRTVIFEIGELLEGDLKAEAVLTAIETALNMVKEGAAETQIRFHPDTGLLIARGVMSQLSTVEQVVDQLRQRHNRSQIEQSQQSRLREEAQEAAQLRDELAKARAELGGTMQEITALQTRRELVEKALEEAHRAAATRDDELRATMADLTAMRIQLEQAATRKPQ